MRLIDADKLHYKKVCCDESYKLTVVVFAKEIDKAPTVEAIPIEWISQWLLKNCYDKNGHYNGEGYDTVGDMLEDWEDEKWYRE